MKNIKVKISDYDFRKLSKKVRCIKCKEYTDFVNKLANICYPCFILPGLRGLFYEVEK